MNVLCRAAGLVLFTVVITGCAHSPQSVTHAERYQCKIDPKSCMYEGSYEPNEEKYAEQRAKELNRASVNKIKRRSLWW